MLLITKIMSHSTLLGVEFGLELVNNLLLTKIMSHSTLLGVELGPELDNKYFKNLYWY